MRGKRDEIVCPVTDNGITPADAGKTSNPTAKRKKF